MLCILNSLCVRQFCLTVIDWHKSFIFGTTSDWSCSLKMRSFKVINLLKRSSASCRTAQSRWLASAGATRGSLKVTLLAAPPVEEVSDTPLAAPPVEEVRDTRLAVPRVEGVSDTPLAAPLAEEVSDCSATCGGGE